jgi:TetR/AcrR family fatty acid metabolism transcriptional regulator
MSNSKPRADRQSGRRRRMTGVLIPKTSRGEKARSKLLQAAVETFAKRGFHATKISDIVRRAGVSQPSFYMYFASKDAIYRSLLSQAHEELLALIKAIRLSPRLDPNKVESGTVNSLTAFLEYFSTNPDLSKIAYFQSAEAEKLKSTVVRMMARNIDAEKRSGYFRSGIDSTFLAECIHGSLERLIPKRLLTGQYTPKKLAEEVASVFIGVLAR